ncbi:hypothetical protein [Bacillus sp. FJAT-49736]|uniref:hypothetical protein n=1 Tax=Bacillus sp. FJAT-49736 TaxID=2833582 RepID=UPI001BC91049|nr:hypothetical protein [Bacillus sp. FJAT-49736]MBS4172070.1 hypothetical protein [Bacillus sp. FJAT-49736]
MGYILPLSFNHNNWKIKWGMLRIKRVEKTKLLTKQREQFLKKNSSTKRSVLHDLNVSSYTYFQLTGKGRLINLKI